MRMTGVGRPFVDRVWRKAGRTGPNPLKDIAIGHELRLLITGRTRPLGRDPPRGPERSPHWRGSGPRGRPPTFGARIATMAPQPLVPETTTRLWDQILTSVKARIESQQAFDTWFRPIQPLHLDPERVTLEVPNPFFVDWIHEHHLPLLMAGLHEVLGSPPEVRLVPRVATPAEPPIIPGAALSSPAPGPAASRPAAPSARPERGWLESQLHPRLTSRISSSAAAPVHARRLPGRGREARHRLQPAVHLRRLRARQDPPAARGGVMRSSTSGPTRASTTCPPSASRTR